MERWVNQWASRPESAANTNDIEALYSLIQEFAGRTRASFAKVNQRFDDLEDKVDGLAGQFGEVLELLRRQS